MNIHDFQAKWRDSTLKERSAAQEHFIDLCRVLGMPTPAEADKTGSFYTFEKGAAKSAGGQGFADVWWRGRFGWEYKGQRADLNAAYQQLLQYREDLDNPPLLVVCDLHRFEVHTNFTGTGKVIYAFTVDDLSEPAPILPSKLSALEILRAVFDDPERLRPEATVEGITKEAAGHFGSIALSLTERGVEPHTAAHYLMQLLFCMFSEDVGLLPKGLFSQLVTFGAKYPAHFTREVGTLFHAMRDGGFYNLQPIDRFNGGLFADIHVESLTAGDLERLSQASRLDWSSVEPAIFGTLFERSLDPAKRSQLGAHYTGREDIERVVEPVVMQPLRRRWEEVRAEADALKVAWDAAKTPAERNRRRQAFANRLFAFQEELAALRIMDVACGSGNFLYVGLAALMDLEKEVGLYGAANGLPMMFPRVSPAQLYGLEINQYAQELTQVVVWIGYLQWMTTNGFQPSRDPVLQPLDTIRLQDALLDRSDPDNPSEAEWPKVDFIIGNPPFLGDKKLRGELGDAYVDTLFSVYRGRVPGGADLVCYFFDKARAQIEAGKLKRAGLLATNSIRGGANRRVIERIKQSGDIFMAWSDEPWILEGAAVRISIVGFDDGSEHQRVLDGQPANAINSDLTGAVDITTARLLPENRGIMFVGVTTKAPFDVPGVQARQWLELPLNPNGRPNSDVLRPVANASDIVRRSRGHWIVDFGVDMSLADAALYEAPFEYVERVIHPLRIGHREARQAKYWWLHARPAPAMRLATSALHRYIATPIVSKHRVFVWMPSEVLCEHSVGVIASDDDYIFGVLHSRAHEVWSLRMGTSLEDRPRYTPSTCFETFPFPCPSDEQRAPIAAAAKRVDELRQAWLNPEGASELDLKKRTLTNLYNLRAAWLANAHAELDRAVWAAYSWDDPEPADVVDDVILARLLALNLAQADPTPAD